MSAQARRSVARTDLSRSRDLGQPGGRRHLAAMESQISPAYAAMRHRSERATAQSTGEKGKRNKCIAKAKATCTSCFHRDQLDAGKGKMKPGQLGPTSGSQLAKKKRGKLTKGGEQSNVRAE
ncbi:hypothetical protein HAX54_043557 [Datura stramonium]|uniref:Uncharacterized protein n=1 Tax=Datura stramonium TaxID=4076 RepID=A0ABS8W3F3_DATST|nr:hypothetical protein [Datura stramonium]